MRNKTRMVLGVLLSLVLTLTFCLGVSAFAEGDVAYLDENGVIAWISEGDYVV